MTTPVEGRARELTISLVERLMDAAAIEDALERVRNANECLEPFRVAVRDSIQLNRLIHVLQYTL